MDKVAVKPLDEQERTRKLIRMLENSLRYAELPDAKTARELERLKTFLTR